LHRFGTKTVGNDSTREQFVVRTYRKLISVLATMPNLIATDLAVIVAPAYHFAEKKLQVGPDVIELVEMVDRCMQLGL
jgi:hypothetical protein